MLLRLLLLLALIVPAFALAQPRLPVDGALYLGTSERGRTLLISLHLFPPDGAELQLLEAPVGPGEEPSIELTLTGPYIDHSRELEVTTETWTFVADLLPDGYLDSLGEAELYLDGLEPIEFEAVGTVLLGDLYFADGTFAIQRWAPFFYAEPWNEVHFDVSMDEIVSEGLQQRRELPEALGGTFTESRMVYLTALDRDLLSYYVLTDTYTGGAHPNTWREAATLMGGDSGTWTAIEEPCAAAAELGWECDVAAVREKVIDDLLRQEAFWVGQGEVTKETEWLLDAFVLTPSGVSILFDPYEVGPYAQGPFEVLIPYGELAE